MALLVQKILGFFLSKSVFSYFKTKKKKKLIRKPLSSKKVGLGGKALVAGPLKKELFCSFPNERKKIMANNHNRQTYKIECISEKGRSGSLCQASALIQLLGGRKNT